ncbi:hypothetical protein [Streptomyces panaciradicis]|uniref:hypothetical protein n=1 Tax=Streptomyces panaciradicis TaxID=1470261 RepID=UPI00201CC363|nr:hypothetical protein [Streptomyces panaciradicis]MCL6669236.1 hypothetical protein [Streptomyces panaciradicis]
MRWWTGAWVLAAVLALAACGSSDGGGRASGSPSGSPSTEPTSGTPAPPSPTPSSSAPSASAASPSPSATGCVAGLTRVTVEPGDPVQRRLCVRPGTVISLVLRPRVDDKRWTDVRSSAPVFVVVTGWRVDADGTAHATLRSAGTRGGSARVTAPAKAPDVAGAARVAFTLDVTVTPYPREG